MTIEAVIELIEIGAIAQGDIVKCLRSALNSNKPYRTWVGLTSEERMDIIVKHNGNRFQVADEIEEKLRSKNT